MRAQALNTVADILRHQRSEAIDSLEPRRAHAHPRAHECHEDLVRRVPVLGAEVDDEPAKGEQHQVKVLEENCVDANESVERRHVREKVDRERQFRA